jgi:hypothetical protein
VVVEEAGGSKVDERFHRGSRGVGSGLHRIRFDEVRRNVLPKEQCQANPASHPWSATFGLEF